MEALFYRIDHKSNMRTFDNETLTQIKSVLFCELASNEENFIGNGINKFFKKILQSASTARDDLMESIYSLADQFIEIANIDINDNVYILKLCQQVAFRNYKMEFIFNYEFVTEIATILAYGVVKMRNKGKMTYKEFIKKVQMIFDANLDLKNNYRNIVDYSNPKIGNFILPNEIILLMNIFMGVKRLKMSLEDSTIDFVKGSLLLLLNNEWLFPYVFEIEIDLTCERMLKEIKEEYKKKLIDTISLKRKKSDSSDNSNGEEEKKELNPYIDLIRENTDVFALVIIYSYHISKFKYLNKLTLNFPHSFKSEIEQNMKLNDMKVVDFHFLDFMLNINKLAKINIEFNALERQSFEKVLSIIQNNSELKSLSINMFCKNEEYYSPSLMAKIGEENGTNLKSIINLPEKKLEMGLSSESGSLDTKIINKLVTDFEENLEKLFLLLQSKKNLDCLTVVFDLPNVISANEKYFLIFMKFIFNIFLMLNRERFHLKELKIIAPCLNFDSRKNLLIENFIEGVNLNTKNKELRLFHFQVQISSMLNISNIISTNLSTLFIGDLDFDTFNKFLDFYQSEAFQSTSQLCDLSISLKKAFFEYDDTMKSNLKRLFGGKNPKNLIKVSFFSNIPIPSYDLSYLLASANGNSVETYVIQIKQNEPKEFLSFNYDCYWYTNDSYNKKLNKYLDVILKYDLIKQKKISKRFLKFLLPRNKKEITILK